MKYYKLYLQIAGQEKKEFGRIYQDTFKQAKHEFSENLRNELSQRNGNILYIESLKDLLELLNAGEIDKELIEKNEKYVKNIDFQGSGYYLFGNCLITDKKDISKYVDDNKTWSIEQKKYKEKYK